MKNFPVGIAGLDKIINDGYYYVDKTAFVERLAAKGGYYFLSRPRRFGKSLFINTLKQAFTGNQNLFKGLYLEHHWDWHKKHPVIHISFASNEQETSSYTLKDKITALLQLIAEHYAVVLRGESHSDQFSFLINDLQLKFNQKVVVLVDEYDKPILDAITDLNAAARARQLLSSFYSVLKDNDEKLQFVFLTGVSKFAKAGIFSGLNNLNDITYDPAYATICGYTQTELENTFAERLTNEDLPKIKLWYNGYYFMSNESVYNPFSVLNFLAKNKHYANYWFESGTPTFLVNLLQQQHFYIPDLENIEITDNDLQSFEIEKLPLVILLLQTGYLTIKKSRRRGEINIHVLTYPNLEVRQSLNDRLATMNVSETTKNKAYSALDNAFTQQRFEQIGQIFSSIFAAIPHDWYRNNNIQHYEGFYCATVYCYLMGLGYNAIAEDVTSQGKIDMTVFLDHSIVILEFKLKANGDAKSALTQIKQQGYANKYLRKQKPIYLLGISFDPETRNVYDFAFEKAEMVE